MLQQERDYLSGVAAEKVMGLFRVNPGAFYEESVRHKFKLLMQAVDRATVGAGRPVLFTGIIPGYDLAVLQPHGAQLVVPPGDEIDPRSVSSVDETCLALLSKACDQHFAVAQQQGEGPSEGVLLYESADQLVYVAFKTEVRAKALASMGVSDDGLMTLDSEEIV